MNPSPNQTFRNVMVTSIMLGAMAAGGTPASAAVRVAPQNQNEADTIEHSVRETSPLDDFDRLKISGHVVAGSEAPKGDDWSRVKFSGKDGVRDRSGVTPEIIRKAQKESAEAMMDIARIDFEISSGSGLFDQGYKLNDHVAATMRLGPQKGREILARVADGSMRAEEAREMASPAVTASMTASLLGGSDLGKRKPVLLAEPEDENDKGYGLSM